MTRVFFSPRAELQADLADDWWRENRPAARILFAEELALVVRRLATNPLYGRSYPRPHAPNTRRVLLTRCRYHVYYEYRSEHDEVWIEDVWGSARGSDPPP